MGAEKLDYNHYLKRLHHMSAPSRYLDFTEGKQNAFLISIRNEKATNDARGSISLRFASQPTAVSHTAPFTNVKLQIPKHEDEAGTKIMFEGKMKQILYPLAGKGQEEKIGLNALYQDIKSTLENSDVECELFVTMRAGNSVDARTGEPRMFSDVAELSPVKLHDKTEYVPDVDFYEAIED